MKKQVVYPRLTIRLSHELLACCWLANGLSYQIMSAVAKVQFGGEKIIEGLNWQPLKQRLQSYVILIGTVLKELIPFLPNSQEVTNLTRMSESIFETIVK